MTFEDEPAAMTILYCQATPSAERQQRGGRTSFIDMQAVTADLPQALLLRIAGLVCGHADTPGKGLVQAAGDMKQNTAEYTRDGLAGEAPQTATVWNTRNGQPPGANEPPPPAPPRGTAPRGALFPTPLSHRCFSPVSPPNFAHFSPFFARSLRLGARKPDSAKERRKHGEKRGGNGRKTVG